MTEITKSAAELCNGTQLVSHYKKKRLHNDTGAAWTLRTPDGLIIELYFRDGVLGRTDGPAITVQNQDGSGAEEYFVNGCKVAPKDLESFSSSPTKRPPRPLLR